MINRIFTFFVSLIKKIFSSLGKKGDTLDVEYFLNRIVAVVLTESIAINDRPNKIDIIREFGINSKFILLPTAIAEACDTYKSMWFIDAAK